MNEIDARKALTQVPSGMAAKLLGIDARTLRRWHARGKIEATRTAAGRWLWDVAGFLGRTAARRPRRASRRAEETVS